MANPNVKVLDSRHYDEALPHLRAELNRRMRILWTHRDGIRIPLTEMSFEHLSNTIAMLERKKERIEAYDTLVAEML